MAQNVYLSALETLWALVHTEAGATVECELKRTFQLLLDPTEDEDCPFALDDSVDVKCTKLKAAILAALPECSAEGKATLDTMFDVPDSASYAAVLQIFTTLRAWISESESSDSESSDSD